MVATRRSVIIYVVVILALIASVFAACVFGSSEIGFRTVLDVLKQQLFHIETEEIMPQKLYIIWNLRLPRALLAFVVGGGLAIAGAAMQSITRNVMADPYVLGVSSGALAFVSAGYLIGGTLVITSWFIPSLAFIGAMFSIALVFIIGGFSKDTSPAKLILSGTAISVTLNAAAQYGIYNSQSSNKANSIISWMMGSLAGARWDNIAIPFLGSIGGVIVFISLARAFDLISLGDETAISLGTNIAWIKRISLVIVAVIAGISVANCGIIGLVGFVIPHVVRFLCGTGHRRLFFISFLTGGVFLIWMDILSRTLLAPQEIPIGIFTALCGGPYFIWILKKKATRR